MSPLAQLKSKNPNVEIKTVTEEAFKGFGDVLKGYDFSQLETFCRDSYYNPEHQGEYVPDDHELPKLGVIKAVAEEVYGDMPLQIGYVTGQNHALTGLEYHQGSETIIAITDMVLILGKRERMNDGYYAADDCELFYLEAGQAVELFATTLHYTPCKVDNEAFFGVVFLPKGTNAPLEQASASKLLFKANKWFITHESQTEKVKQGAFPGLTGELIELQI